MDEPLAPDQPTPVPDDSPSLENVQHDLDADLEMSADEIDEQYRRAVEALNDADWDVPAGDAVATEAAEQHESTQPEEPASKQASTDEDGAERTNPRFTPMQILEAALFVGGTPLSSKKLASLLGDSFDSTAVQALVDELNHTYDDEARPYEVQLGEGGYNLSLRESYARVRDRTFGIGPREVRLSQDALEVLAFVAYQQPVTREETEQTGKQNAGSLLSQLVRRQLIAVHRDSENPKLVHYRTTDRFLSVFGIGGIDELPLVDALASK